MGAVPPDPPPTALGGHGGRIPLSYGKSVLKIEVRTRRRLSRDPSCRRRGLTGFTPVKKKLFAGGRFRSYVLPVMSG